MASAINSSALPSAMEGKLQSIRRRQIALAILRAVAIGAAALLIVMLVAMSIDWWFTLFNTGVRTALTTGSVVLAAGILLTVGARPVLDA